MTTKKQTAIPHVGLDDGHYSIKVCAGRDKCYTIRSRAMYGIFESANLYTGETNDSSTYSVDETEFTIAGSSNAYGEKVIDLKSLKKPIYPLSDVNAVLSIHAMAEAGIHGDVTVVTGLPFLEYFLSNRKRNEELIEAKKLNYNRKIKNYGGLALPNVVSHEVMPEGTGAYLDLLFDFDGNQVAEIAEASSIQPISIVDIGGKTTDIVTIAANGVDIIQQRSNTVNFGALDLNEKVSALIKTALKLESYPTPEAIEKAIMENTYAARGQLHDVSDVVKNATKMHARKLRDEVVKVLTHAEDIGRICFVGGGSHIFRDDLKELYGDQSYFVKDPEFSNARGFYKAKFISPAE